MQVHSGARASLLGHGSTHHGFLYVQSSQNMLQGSTGCHLWPAGLWLAEWVLQRPHLFRGRRVLELGCGVGALGACLHLAGARQVRQTCICGQDQVALQRHSRSSASRYSKASSAVSLLATFPTRLLCFSFDLQPGMCM